jgi:hypothetical protein
MSDAFTVLWTHDTCRALRKAGRVGERPPVAFSGVHSSLPTWTKANAGDEVYALHVNQREVFVVSHMRVIDRERRGCCGPSPATGEDPAYSGHSDWSALGTDGCGAEAVHVEATPIRFDMAVPGELLQRLTWRNRRGKTRCLKYVVDGRLMNSVSLQGFYRLTPEAAGELAEIVGSNAI